MLGMFLSIAEQIVADTNCFQINFSKKVSTGKTFSYCCKNVVLANGVSDLPNRMGLKAESMEIPWIKHELPQLEKSLEELNVRERASMN